MALSSLDEWHVYNRINVSLADVVGTPGIAGGHELASRLSRSAEARFDQVSATDFPFLVGTLAALLPGSPRRQLNGFLGATRQLISNVGERSSFSRKNVKVLATQTSATGTHITAQQTIRDTEIVGARTQLHLDQGRAYAFTGRPIGDVAARDPGEAPMASHQDATDAIRKLFNLPVDSSVSVQRVVFPVDGYGIWAYQGRFVVYNPVADVRAFVRGDDPSILLYSYNAATAALRGEANIYRVSPARTPELQRVRLDRIGPIPPDRLTGPSVSVRRPLGEFSHPERDCRLNPDDEGFDEAHAFYHLSNARRYFEAIVDGKLMEAAPFVPIKVLVRDTNSPRNAYFVPTTGELLFGDFGSRPSARSADIIYHEFAHAISDAICRLNRTHSDTESRGMSEGFSDYFAASALNDPRIGDYLINRPEGARSCAKADLRFPPRYAGAEHATGEVWSAFLWSVRGRCGAEVTDILAVESLQFLHSLATFEDGLAALITADRRLFPSRFGLGRHEDALREEFDARRPPAA